MTLAVETSAPLQPTTPQTVPIVILGTDAILAALPATPVQLAHACMRAGFANAIPASWGDELIAAGVLRRLPQFGDGPAVQCSCPIVAHRLLSVGGDLRAVMLPTVSPPVALARYVRTLSQPTRTRITYVGSCPGAIDDSIDIRMSPDALLSMLAERQIVVDDQPRVFESIIPPDRRRFRSLPGGLPTAEALWTELGARTLVELESDDLVGELAQHLLGGKNILIDVAPRVGCVCSGAVVGTTPKESRASVTALEPPRATTPIVEEQAPISLDMPIPAAPRTPVDVAAIPLGSRGAPPIPVVMRDAPIGHRISPVRTPSPPEARQSRPSGPTTPRPVLGNLPVARDTVGKSLPRAYIARRRSSPKGFPAVPSPGSPSNAPDSSSHSQPSPPEKSEPEPVFEELPSIDAFTFDSRGDTSVVAHDEPVAESPPAEPAPQPANIEQPQQPKQTPARPTATAAAILLPLPPRRNSGSHRAQADNKSVAGIPRRYLIALGIVVLVALAASIISGIIVGHVLSR